MLHGRGNIESEFLRRLKPHTGHTSRPPASRTTASHSHSTHMHTHLQYTTGLAVDLFWHLTTPLATHDHELGAGWHHARHRTRIHTLQSRERSTLAHTCWRLDSCARHARHNSDLFGSGGALGRGERDGEGDDGQVGDGHVQQDRVLVGAIHGCDLGIAPKALRVEFDFLPLF